MGASGESYFRSRGNEQGGRSPPLLTKQTNKARNAHPLGYCSGHLIQHIVLHGMWTGTLDSNVREHMLSTTLELGAVPNRNRSNNEQPRLDTAGPVLIFGEIRVGFRKLLDIAMCPISPICFSMPIPSGIWCGRSHNRPHCSPPLLISALCWDGGVFFSLTFYNL